MSFTSDQYLAANDDFVAEAAVPTSERSLLTDSSLGNCNIGHNNFDESCRSGRFMAPVCRGLRGRSRSVVMALVCLILMLIVSMVLCWFFIYPARVKRKYQGSSVVGTGSPMFDTPYPSTVGVNVGKDARAFGTLSPSALPIIDGKTSRVFGTPPPSVTPEPSSYIPTSEPRIYPSHEHKSDPILQVSSNTSLEINRDPSLSRTPIPSFRSTIVTSEAPSVKYFQDASTLMLDTPFPSSTPEPSAALLKTSKPSVYSSQKTNSNASLKGTSDANKPPTPIPSFRPTSKTSEEYSMLVANDSPPLVPPPSISEYSPPIFYVMGDVPYDEAEHQKLKLDISRIPNDADFVVHVGDMNRAANTNCTRKVYAGVQSTLKKTNNPVFMIPGDNDVFDCPRASEAVYHWREHFLSFENRWIHNFQVERQKLRPENFAFFHKRMLFLGLYIIAGLGGGPAEKLKRERDCLEWTIQNIAKYEKEPYRMDGIVIFAHKEPPTAFFKGLGGKLISLDIPILYIHGNGHKWLYKRGIYGVQNMVLLQVDKGGIAAPLRITFQNDGPDFFFFERRK